MKRHTREMTRHHRERIIKKKRHLLDHIWFMGSGHMVDGKLAKFTTHHHHCGLCTYKYKRDNRWKTEVAQQY